MPVGDPISRALDLVWRQFQSNDEGEVAEYIPQLATVDPRLFGIALASMQGHLYSAGDSKHLFTIQSVSKPFVYAMALSDLGLEGTLSRVGAEPSGEAFNAISLEPGTGRPANPMINAGAIVTTSLVQAADAASRFGRIRSTLSAFAGRELTVDQAVYESETATGDMNRALAYLMRNAGSLTEDPTETLDVYFRQCSLLVTAEDIAVMAATLANGGLNPVTGRQVISDQIAGLVLTVMSTCGMYDSSGEWLLRVGLPAKSGVSGAMVAASPAQFGVGLFSPRLDAQGNSVRGVAACRDLSERFELHLMNPVARTLPVFLVDTKDGALAEGISTRIVQGDLTFACAEVVLRSFDGISAEFEKPQGVVLDLQRVARVHSSGAAVLQGLVANLQERQISVVMVDATDRGLLPGVRSFTTRDEALHWCRKQKQTV